MVESPLTNCTDEDYKKVQLRVLNFPIKKENFSTSFTCAQTVTAYS